MDIPLNPLEKCNQRQLKHEKVICLPERLHSSFLSHIGISCADNERRSSRFNEASVNSLFSFLMSL